MNLITIFLVQRNVPNHHNEMDKTRKLFSELEEGNIITFWSYEQVKP